MKKQLKIRAVQIDLARQMETVEFIKEYIDFTSSNGFNTLFLYLEGRVKTKSPYPSPDESYNEDEIKDIVSYAAQKGMDVIPGLACLGHAELFFKHPEMVELAELADGRNGRFWNNNKMVFCPSNPKTLDFLKAYLNDICDLFPSQFIHIGLDEAWDVGYCDKCSEAAHDFSLEQQLYQKIIMHCHGVLEKRDRRLMMWDDMFEHYTDILPELPRDIIMVCWQYQADVRYIKGHFSNFKNVNALATYEKLGFDYLIAPADYLTTNIHSLTEYASDFNPLGGLLTSWERKHSFIEKILPKIAYAGKLWSCDEDISKDQIYEDVVTQLFGSQDPLLIQAVRAHCETKLAKEGYISLPWLMSLPQSGMSNIINELKLLNSAFEASKENIQTQLGQAIYSDIILTNQFNICKYQLKELVWQLFTTSKSKMLIIDELKQLEKQLEKLSKIRVREWQQIRKGIRPCNYEIMYQTIIDLVRSLPEMAEKNSMMKVRFCLPDQYSAEYCRIELKYGNNWQEAAAGSFKCLDKEEAFFNVLFLVDKMKKPQAIRFEFEGYGGQGLCFVEIINDQGHFIPEKVNKIEGNVIDPEYCLDDDCKWSFFGEKNTVGAFANRKLAQEKHNIEISLKKAN